MLKYQEGNCFDFSTLLCSMLLGAGYDAYCVYGYGSQDLCHMDLTREVCPLTVKPKEVRPGLCCPQHRARHATLKATCPCCFRPCPSSIARQPFRSSYFKPLMVSPSLAS